MRCGEAHYQLRETLEKEGVDRPLNLVEVAENSAASQTKCRNSADGWRRSYMLVFCRENIMSQGSGTGTVKTIKEYVKRQGGWSLKGVCCVNFPQRGIMEGADLSWMGFLGGYPSRTYLCIAKEGVCYLHMNTSRTISDAQFFDWSELSGVSVSERKNESVVQFKHRGNKFWFACREFHTGLVATGDCAGLLTDVKSFCLSLRRHAFRAMWIQRKKALQLRSCGFVRRSISSRLIRAASVA